MLDPDSAPQISVIVVTWNSDAYLPRCLDSLEAQTYKDFEVIFIDNASTDGTRSQLEGLYPSARLRVELLEKNIGFAAANNLGARLARSPWLALLNSDAFPQPDWLACLWEATKQYPDFSFFGSRQVQADDPGRLDGAGDVYHISGLAWRRFTDGSAEHLGLKCEEIFSPCAAAALYSREAFLQAGGFDEDFFSYLEDVDLGFRLRLAGFRSMYIPQAVVKHVGSGSTGKKSSFAIYHGHRNLAWTYVKDMPTPLFWLYLPFHLAMNAYSLLYYSLQGQTRAIWKAKWDGLRGLGLMLRKRKTVQRGRRAPVQSLYQQMNRDWLAPWKKRSAR